MNQPTRKQSDRSIARALGVALSSFQNARDTGRITVTDPLDIEALRAQWIASSKAQGPAPMADRAIAGAIAPAALEQEGGETLAAARLRREIANADKAEVEIARVKGELVPARDVVLRWSAILAQCKTRLLAIPTRARQDLPHLSISDVTAIDGLIREALEDLADDRAGAP